LIGGSAVHLRMVLPDRALRRGRAHGGTRAASLECVGIRLVAATFRVNRHVRTITLNSPGYVPRGRWRGRSAQLSARSVLQIDRHLAVVCAV